MSYTVSLEKKHNFMEIKYVPKNEKTVFYGHILLQNGKKKQYSRFIQRQISKKLSKFEHN